MTVLLVDDEDSFRLVMREVLSALPEFRVLDCDSGEAAIEMLKQEAIDLVVLDYKMPRLTGLNVLQWINEQKMEVPVVMLTAAGTETVAVEAMKLGAYDYMRKEHIDVAHTPIILKGVYERFLFRQEREQREHLEKERTASVVAIEAFHDTLATLAQIANTTLSILSANIDTCEKELKKHPMSEDKQSELVARISDMKQNFSVIASSVKSMFSIANLLHGNFGDAQYATQIREQIKDKLRTVDVQKVEITTDKSKN